MSKVETERQLVGTLLCFGDGYENIANFDAGYFEDKYSFRLLRWIRAAVDSGKAYDSVSLCRFIEDSDEVEGLGGQEGIWNFSQTYGISLALLPKLVEELRDHANVSSAKRTAKKLSTATTPQDVAEIVSELEKINASVPTRAATSRECFVEFIKDLEAITRGERKEISTGFRSLDSVLLGFNPGNLVILAARPGMGKTAFALSLMHNLAKDNKRCVFFSLEMSKGELTQRNVSMRCGIPLTKLRVGALNEHDWSRITSNSSALTTLPFDIIDQGAMTTSEMKAEVKRLSMGQPVRAVFVDYLQLLEAKAQSREREVAEITRGLKQLAKETNTVVIALAQLNRDLEKRGDKRPQTSDLRESGAIEQDADVIMFLYRDDVYNDDSNERGICEVDIAKHRSGPTGMVKLAFDSKLTRFSELEQYGRDRPTANKWMGQS